MEGIPCGSKEQGAIPSRGARILNAPRQRKKKNFFLRDKLAGIHDR